MDEPIIVALSEKMRGPAAEQIAAVSPRVRIAWVSPSGEPREDVAAVQVLFRGGGLEPAGLRRLVPLMPRLRWVHAIAAGVDADLAPEVLERDVVVTRARGQHLWPVSEWVILQILAVTKRLPTLVLAQQAGEWRSLEVPATINGRTLGIVGYGEIGHAVAERARGFGLRIVGTRRQARPAPELDAVYPREELGRLLAESDYVVILTPLTRETRGMIDAAALRQMKPTAWLVNVARGEIVDEPALLRALREGWIAGAALDVFGDEPLPPDSPWWKAPNVLITPHNGGVKDPAFGRRGFEQFLANLARYVRSEPLHNQVDKAAGY